MSLLSGQVLSRENLNAAFLSKAEDNYIFSDIISTGAISVATLSCTAGLTATGTINGLTLAAAGITGSSAIYLNAGGTDQNVYLVPTGTGHIIMNGNVAIGDQFADEKLDVTGNLKLSGNLTDGAASLTVANAKAAYDHSLVSHLQLGTTSDTAYRGDYGQAAYTHITSTGEDHTYINQDVTQAAKPTFCGINNTGRIEISTSSGDSTNSAPRAISWYNYAYNTWADYMAPAGATAGYNGTARTALGTVTSWARVSSIENNANYGWIWESGPNSTAAPTAKMALASDTGNLYLTGNAYITGKMSANGTTLTAADGTGYGFWETSDGSYRIYMSSSANATYGGKLDATSDYNMYFKMTGGTNRGFVFRNGDTNVAQIDSAGSIYTNGNINIGSSSSTVDNILTITSTANAGIRIVADTDNATENQSPYVYFLQDGGAVTGVIGFVGNAGSSPVQELGFTGTLDNSMVVGSFYGGCMHLGTAGATRMTIDGAGKVGIGITAPTEALHVVGNLKVTGTITGTLADNSYTNYSIQYNSTMGSLDIVYTG